ncbi:MAG: translocation/assembly module TamB domain-containing protein [Candidatus Sulfotelmatobacter sp.]
MTWKRRIGWAAIAFGVLLVVIVIGGYAYLKTSSFNRFARRKIAEEVYKSTGGRTTIGGLDFSLSQLTVHLYDITLRGTEAADQPALLHVDKIAVGIKIVSLLHGKATIRELLIEHPVVNVEVSRSGENNFPTASNRSSSSSTSVFDLAVGHAEITNGEIDYKDQKTPLDADLYDLGTDIRFTSMVKRYDGVLSYKSGRLRYANYAPLAHDFDLRFSATPEKLTVESANLHVGSSSVTLQAEVSNYSNPVADGSYQVLIHAQDFDEFSASAKTQGNVSLTGKLHYQEVKNQPLLRNVSIDGHLASELLLAAASGKRLTLRKLGGDFKLNRGNLVISHLSVDTLGGRLQASAEMNHLDSTPDSHLRASLQSISRRAVQQSLGNQQLHGAAVSGEISGDADASWEGAIDNLQAHTDLTLRAEAAGTANPSATDVPINGTVHANYDGRSQSVELRNTVIKVPSASVTAHGRISDHSSLQIAVVADDLHQLEQLASSFRSEQNLPPVSGKATLSAVVRGSLRKPTVSGQLNATNLEVRGTEWASLALAVQASPSQLNVENGRLMDRRRQGHASFSAAIPLHDWSYEPSDRIQANLNAQQFEIVELQQLVGQHYPISGVMSANVSFDGSKLEPTGTGNVAIAKAIVYGEPLQQVTANFHTDNGAIVSNATVAGKAGRLDGNLSYAPKTKAYKVRVDVPGIALQHLQMLQAKNLQLNGTVTASITGEGTVDNPQLVARVELPELQAKGKSISDLKAEARVAQHRLAVNVDSQVSQVAVHAKAQVDLTGGYEAQANLDTGTIPLETLFAAFTSSVPSGVQGETEIHASLSGPLKDKTRVQAHLSIPVLKASYQSLQLGIVSPIRADYANSVVTLQPADFEGTGTTLRVQGRLPIESTSASTMAAQGSVDLRILKIFAPDVQSAGTLALDVRTSGTAGNPAIQGQMQLKDVALTTPDAPLGVEKLNGSLDISNDRIQISKMTGMIGGGEFSVGGAITYRPSLQFSLALQSKSTRLLYPDGIRTLLDANLAFSGTPAASTLNGRVLIDSLSFTPDFDLSSLGNQFSNGGTVSQPGFADKIKLAIGVQSRETLNATSSQVSIAGQAALQVGGTAANPVITGRTTLNSGELFYRNVRYRLQRGVITFDDPNQTHPVLDVVVNTTVEQYNLTLTLRGALDKLTTSYVSDPPLATADVINLIARGKTTQESAASAQSTDSMIASQAVSQLSSSVQKLAGISSLEIDPTIGGNGQNPSARVAIQQRVTKNLLFTFSTDVSQPGSEIVQGEYQLNKRWSVSVERDQVGGVSVDGRYHTKF